MRKEGFVLAQFRICVCLCKWDVRKIQAPAEFRKRVPAPPSRLELQLQLCEPLGMGAGLNSGEFFNEVYGGCFKVSILESFWVILLGISEICASVLSGMDRAG